MKKLIATFSSGLYKKLEAYAKENEISIRAAIRYIITQFFKEKK